ncbi:hypothetical protein K2173_008971 [Erythroxylum novogranatense]|uniref:CCHC-type domain-containing protein n=1 Tax=Erythroxylum novogranatense TaxID=1862640 RepID=A0AAV8TVE1_9ROSI|nr:hypothetical protein K2173_008971 [Erythroxylum novogranatense]
METTKSAPTGCYKCGRPGHWSRDCPDSNPNSNPIPNPNPNHTAGFSSNKFNTEIPKSAAADKPKKVPRTRPKLTPELLLGDDGLGYVLRYFPRHFKYRGRGHEVKDLGNLIRLYSEWHSHMLPYYSFDQFVNKVERVAATKHVKTCIKDLRERVARGGDPTKLRESPPEHVIHDDEQEVVNYDGVHEQGAPTQNHDSEFLQEDLLHEIYEKVTEEPTGTSQGAVKLPDQNVGTTSCTEALITDEQRARMEANRLKALERAAARLQ